MNLRLRPVKGIRDTLLCFVCFIAASFNVYYLYLDMQYRSYRAAYTATQAQEVQTVTQKIATTLSALKTFAEGVAQEIHRVGEDSIKIQNTLKSAHTLSEKQRSSIPFVPTLTYYKLTGPKAVITPSFIAPLLSLPPSLDKPLKALESLTSHNNEMVGMIPILDKDHRLKGILETRVSSIQLQKVVGADQVTTLAFPPLFDKEGKQIIQKDPLAFSLIPLRSHTNFLLSHKMDFWILVYAIGVGIWFMAILQRVLNTQARLAYGTQVGQLRQEWEARHSFQTLLLHRFKEATHIVHKVLERLGGSSLTPYNKEVLMRNATILAHTLSCGVTNYERKPLNVAGLLQFVKEQVSPKIRELNLRWTVECPEPLIFIGDELFTKQLLLNAMGVPLYYMPKNAEVLISVTQNNGYVGIEIQDPRFVLTPSAKTHLFLPETWIEETALREICMRHHIGYESSRSKDGITTTKISFPEDADNINSLTLVSSPSEMLH